MRVNERYNINLYRMWAKADNDINMFNTVADRIPTHVLQRVFNTGVGIEIEVEKASPVVVTGWECVQDGSLRGDGFEFKTEYGARIHHVPNLLAALVTQLNKYSPLRTYSERCSVHIHLDIRRFNEEQIQNLLALYVLVEEGLFRLAGAHRHENIFCIPVRQALNSHCTSIWDYIETCEKYSALNLKCAREFGTVEFRHMEGTDDPDRLYQWILMLGLLHYAAATMDHETLKFEINRLKTESYYEKFLQKIFFGMLSNLPWNHPHLDASVSDSKFFFMRIADQICVD